MPDSAVTQRFETLVQTGQGDPAALARAAKQGDVAAALDLAALLTRAGWVEPGTIRDVYDAAAAGWFGYDHPTADLTRGTGACPSARQPSVTLTRDVFFKIGICRVIHCLYTSENRTEPNRERRSVRAQLS